MAAPRHVTIKRRERHLAYKFVMDGILNYVVFVPLVVALNTLTIFFGLPYWDDQTVYVYLVTSVFVAFFFGGIFGRVLNAWRKKFNYH